MLHVLCCSCSALSLINLSEDDLGWTLPATVLLFAPGSRYCLEDVYARTLSVGPRGIFVLSGWRITGSRGIVSVFRDVELTGLELPRFYCKYISPVLVNASGQRKVHPVLRYGLPHLGEPVQWITQRRSHQLCENDHVYIKRLIGSRHEMWFQSHVRLMAPS